jgi:hypothetical protein
MNRCQAQYLHPVRGEWVDCARKAVAEREVDGTRRVICPEHQDQVRKVAQAGRTGELRWSDQPTPPRRPSRVMPGQQQLVDIAPVIKPRPKRARTKSRRPA